MPTQDVDAKLDFLVQDAKDSKEEYDREVKEQNAVKVICGVTVAILLLLISVLIGFKFGYDAGVQDMSQRIIMEKMGIL
jgi:hypothetical protein